MRIAFITSGAAGMYCGSCMRDNTLATALIELGHDCLLIPTYTPLRTDEPDVSTPQIFFGGISVYLEQQYAWMRRMPRFLDRLLSRRWLLNLVSKRAIQVEAEKLAELTLSMLRGLEGNQRVEVLRLVEWLEREAKPDVVVLSNVLISGLLPHLQERLRVPVMATLQGDDIYLESLPPAAREECKALIRGNVQYVRGYLTTSGYYADFMAGYLGLPREVVHVVYPGLNLKGFDAPPTEGNRPLTVGYFARVCPEKGLHNLVEAFDRLRKRPRMPLIRLRVAGYLPPHQRDYLEEQRRCAERGGWGTDFEYAGEPDHLGKLAFLRSLDLFSVPTTYREPKGLYVLEALACGVPVVQPDHGSFPELVNATCGGVLVPPDNPDALADTLAMLVQDHDQRRRLAAQGRAVVHGRFTARRMAEETAGVLSRYLS